MTQKQTTHCFARNHMTCRQYGLWTTVRERQSKFGFIYFDGDDLSAGFQRTSRTVIYDECNALLDAGWFRTKGVRNRKKDGTYEARKIVALSHKEWATEHPNKCLSSPPQTTGGTGVQSAPDESPVRKSGVSSPPQTNDQSAPDDKDMVKSRQGSQQTGFKADKVPSEKSAGGLFGVDFDSSPTTTTTFNPSGNPTLIFNMRAGSPVGVKASDLAKSIIIKAAPDYSDPYIASDRAKAVRAAREDDHTFCIGDECVCCRIKLAAPDRRFCRDCDNECDGDTCQMQDMFLALHRDFGGDWRDSVFAPFNEKRLVEVAGKVVAHAVRVALNSSPNNAATNLDRVLQLIEHRIKSVSRLKPTAGVVAALEDLHTTALVVARHCENVWAAVTVLDNSPVAAGTGSCEQ